MKTHRRNIFKYSKSALLFIGLAGAALLLAGCSCRSESMENRSNRVLPAVEAVQARHGSLPLTQRLSGVVKAKNQVEIYAEISAAIVAV